MKSVCLYVIAAAAALVVAPAHAQIIWGTPTAMENDGGESDVNNNYAYVDAFQALPSTYYGLPKPTLTVNGVKFNADDGSLTDGVITFGGNPGVGSDGSQGKNLSTNYSSVTAGCLYVDDAPGDYTGAPPTGTITFNVTAGNVYQVQLWDAYANNYRDTIFSSGASSVLLTGSDYVVGTFLATGPTFTINYNGTMVGGSSGVGEVNAVSLELVPEPSTYAMMLAGFAMLGFGVRRVRRA